MRKRTRENLVGYCFILPAVIFTAAMIAYPIVYDIILSFENVTVMTMKAPVKEFVGIKNYIDLWNNGILKDVLLQTVIFTVFSLIFQFTIGLLLATLFSKKIALAPFARGALLAIWVMPVTVSALTWKYMFTADSGLINYVLTSLGILKQPLEWLVDQKTAMFAVIITNIWLGVPFNMILLSTGLTNIPDELYEAAEIDGANGFAKFFRITIPLLKASIMSVLVLGFIGTFKIFDLIFVLTGGGPVQKTDVMATYSYRLSFVQYNFSQGAAVANVLFVCLFIIGVVYLRLISKEEVID